MLNAGLDESQAEIKISRRNINNLKYADDTTLMAESKKELKSPLMNMKEESEKDGLKLSIQKTKIVVSSPITLWQIDGKKMETVRDFIFLGFKSLQMVTAAMKILAPWKKNYGKPRQCIKNQDITLLTKVHIVKAMVQMWESDQKEG